MSNCKLMNVTEKDLSDQCSRLTKEFELTFKTPEKTEKIMLSGTGSVKVSTLV